MKIRLEHLTKQFPGIKKDVPGTIAVNDLDIDIPDGKLVGLLGPSGCGKSTTLYMISGLLEPTSGAIWFGDEDVTKLTPDKRGIGLVFQNYALYPHMTVYKNIAFPLENLRVEKENKEGKLVKRRLTKAEIDSMVKDAAQLVQIDNLLDRKPSQLSGGQQQRVAIARALVKKPRVLLLDEPLSNLDARLRLQTREEIRRLQKETGITTIFVTHDQEEAMSISDEIVVMKLGVEQQRAEPQEVYNNPANLFVAQFLGTPPIAVFNGTVKDDTVYIGGEFIRKLENHVDDQDVFVGIRPEGFVVDKNGTFHINTKQIETLGRDISIVGGHDECLKESFKVIVDADNDVRVGVTAVNVKPHKCFIFSKETEVRLDAPAKRKAVEEEPVVETPVAQEAPASEEPVVEAPVVEEKVEETPVVAEETKVVVKKTAAKKPAAKKTTTAKKPAAKKTTTKKSTTKKSEGKVA